MSGMVVPGGFGSFLKMEAIAGDLFLIGCSSGSDHSTFDIQDCVWYRFEMRTGFVKLSLFCLCDISSIQVLRLNLSFLVIIGFHHRL